MKDDLTKKAEELEQTLQAQMNLLKSGSQDWVKIGSGVLVGGLVAFGLVKVMSGGKDKKTKKVMAVLEKEGLLDDEIAEKLTSRKQSGLMGRLAAILIPMLITYGRDRFMNSYLNAQNEEVEDEE